MKKICLLVRADLPGKALGEATGSGLATGRASCGNDPGDEPESDYLEPEIAVIYLSLGDLPGKLRAVVASLSR